MPIRSKYTVGDRRPIAARQFTAREDFIAAFQRARSKRKPDAHRVLVYCGVSGIGKTSLRKELQRMIADKPDSINAALDLDFAGYRDPETALFGPRGLEGAVPGFS